MKSGETIISCYLEGDERCGLAMSWGFGKFAFRELIRCPETLEIALVAMGVSWSCHADP